MLSRVLLLCLLGVGVVFWSDSRLNGGGLWVSASLSDHHTLIYTLPRPGVLSTEDCYTNLYADDLVRDLTLMSEIGVTTVMTWNGWDFARSHSVLLSTMAKYGMSLGITFKPDLNGVMRKSLQKLSKMLSAESVKLEFLYLDYPLDFDNAEQFFRWVIQVRSWMYQENLGCPLLLRFFPQVSNPKTVQVLLQQWDEGDFSAWVVEAYSSASMKSWSEDRMIGNKKKIFFLYGSDSWDLANNNETLATQSAQLEELVQYVTTGGSNSTSSTTNSTSNHLLSGAIQGYSDTWFLGVDANYFQGGANDVCPDKNPYLHTSCGGNDMSIEHGDAYYSVEHMGLMKHYETVYYFRCLQPTPAAQMLQALWNPTKTSPTLLTATSCSLSVSVPTVYVFYMWGAGLAVAILGLCTGYCKAKCGRCSNKTNKDPGLTV